MTCLPIDVQSYVCSYHIKGKILHVKKKLYTIGLPTIYIILSILIQYDDEYLHAINAHHHCNTHAITHTIFWK